MTPTERSLVPGVDVSGSMASGTIAGVPGLTPRETAAAIALVTVATEPNVQLLAFADHLVPLTISPKDRLADAVRATSNLPFGRTDYALPMLWAIEQRAQVDGFMVLTDNETWFGQTHPVQALRQYRAQSGRAAKLVVEAFVSNGFSIADPNDAGMLDIAGLDTATPQLVSDFLGDQGEDLARD